MTDQPNAPLQRPFSHDREEAPLSSGDAQSSLTTPVDAEDAALDTRPRWGLSIGLFVTTVLSVFMTGAAYMHPELLDDGILRAMPRLLRAFPAGWTFAVPLMSILLVHELGHYVAARIHRVPASLPYFLPLPLLSPFGTMGAVIAMKGRIRSRNALLDIGAAGPLAGLIVAIPVIAIGLSLSPIGHSSSEHYEQEGQSLLYLLLKRLVIGPIPDGQDVWLHPTAFAGWAGLLVTMINLLPWGQLDGGHVAFALFGAKQNRIARRVRLFLLPLFGFNLLWFLGPVLLGRSHMPAAMAVGNSMFWLVWFVMLGVIARISGGEAHPPFEPGELTMGRKAVAWVTLAFFVLLFMPTPMASY